MKYQDLIDDYLRGRLTPDEIRKVEQMAKTDKDFREELAFHRQAKSAFARQTHSRLKSRLQSLPDRSLKADFRNSYWQAVAIVLLFLGVALYLWTLKAGITNSMNLYLAHFEPYPNVVLPVTRDTPGADSRALAYASYEQGEYEKAYGLFGDLSDSEDPETLFYRGVSAMNIDRPAEAIALFVKYRQKGSARLLRQAQWYQGLAHLLQGERPEAAELFAALAAQPGYKQKEASEILIRL